MLSLSVLAAWVLAVWTPYTHTAIRRCWDVLHVHTPPPPPATTPSCPNHPTPSQANSQKNRFRMMEEGSYKPRPWALPQLPWGTLHNPRYVHTRQGAGALAWGGTGEGGDVRSIA